MGWAAAAKAVESTGGKFLKLKETGSTANVVFMGQPAERRLLWNGSGYEDGWGNPEAYKKFPVAVYNVDEGAPQILEMTPGLLKKVAGQIELVGEEAVFAIRRNGTGKDTEWIVASKGPPDEGLAARIAGEEAYDVLSELEGCREIGGVKASDVKGDPPADDIPF